MATYKQPCIQCGEMIERDSKVCVKCASRNPFGYKCPKCFKPIVRGNAVCGGCGKDLLTACPYCGDRTFIGSEKCDVCGKSIMIRCGDKRCGQLQYFENTKCTACGKPIKDGKKQIANGGK